MNRREFVRAFFASAIAVATPETLAYLEHPEPCAWLLPSDAKFSAPTLFDFDHMIGVSIEIPSCDYRMGARMVCPRDKRRKQDTIELLQKALVERARIDLEPMLRAA